MSKQGQHDLKIRAAMDRLLIGKPLHTDGRLHVKNLASAAGVSRQTVYRTTVRAEFEEQVRRIAERNEAPTEQHLLRIQKLQKQLAEEKKCSARYRAELDEERQQQAQLANQIIVMDRKNHLAAAKPV